MTIPGGWGGGAAQGCAIYIYTWTFFSLLFFGSFGENNVLGRNGDFCGKRLFWCFQSFFHVSLDIMASIRVASPHIALTEFP